MRFCWRLGWPGWRVFARLGVPIEIKIAICRDEEAKVYWATSHDIGLGLESETLDGLMSEIHAAVPELLKLTHTPISNPKPTIRIYDHFVAA